MSGPLRILCLVPFSPRRDAPHGGGRVTAGLLLGLAARHRVALLHLRAEGEPPADDLLRQRCDLVEELPRPTWKPQRHRLRRLRKGVRAVASAAAERPLWVRWSYAPELARRLPELARSWRPDVVQVELHVMGQYLPALDGCPAPRVLTQHEPGAAAAREALRAATGAARLEAALDLLAWRRFESGIARRVDAVVAFTGRDRDELCRRAPATPVVVIPPGFELPERALDPAGHGDPRLLFAASYHHPPNVDAALRLATGIFPRIRERCPAARLDLVGAAPPPELVRAAGPGVHLAGEVESVVPWLDRAALVVAPLRRGGGMRVKVLEALAAGKALVASPLATEGLAVTDGRELLLAESDAEFAGAALALLEDPARRVALAGRARAWALAHLGWERPLAAYEALYERLLAGAPAGAEDGAREPRPARSP